jgi:hypothetical protein
MISRLTVLVAWTAIAQSDTEILQFARLRSDDHPTNRVPR